jgi:hypothetical protein
MRDKRVLKIRAMFMVTAVIIHAYHILIVVRRFILNVDTNDWKSPWILVYILTGFIRLLMDLYIFITSFKYLIFLLRRRIQKYRSTGKKIPLKSKLKMAWTTFVVFLVGFEVTSIFVVSIFIPTTDSEVFLVIMSYQRFLMFPLLELIFASTIIYIFYQQGISANKESCITDPRLVDFASTVETRQFQGLDRSQDPYD